MASRAELEAQAAQQTQVVDAAWAQVQAGWLALGLTSAAVQTQTAVQAVQDLLENIVSAWGEVAGTLAADFYDTLREQAGVSAGFTALVPDPLKPVKVAGAVRWALDPASQAVTVSTGPDPDDYELRVPDELNVDRMLQKLQGPTQRLIRESQRAAIEDSSIRDPARPRVARVPTGAKTCAFCLVLASRGYVYRSLDSAGLDNAFHNDCDCEQDVQWSRDDTPPAGYDPGDLFSQYDDARQAAGSPDLKQVLRELRRQQGIR